MQYNKGKDGEKNKGADKATTSYVNGSMLVDIV
jgi:hypothetical protein